MLKNWRFLLLIAPLLMLTSCIDIVDDLMVNRDGSGTLKVSVNLSKSKVKVNSVLALDSLYGYKVPKMAEISDKINFYAEKLRKEKGIENVEVEQNTTDFIFKFTIQFSNVEQLEKALKKVVNEENTSWVDFNFDWVTWDGSKLTRNNIRIPEEQLKKLKTDEKEALNQGTYVSITRFQDPISEWTNEKSKLSGNQLSLMIRTSAYSMAENTQSLQNTISVKAK